MGVLVSSLVGGVTDIDDGAVKGIAITGVNTTKGTLYYSLDGGTNWTALTDASDSTARLLGADADNRVYFRAAAGTRGPNCQRHTLGRHHRVFSRGGHRQQLRGRPGHHQRGVYR
jgi:photosystem II stability/assembly factor-like uncharacterized protein